MDRNRDLAQGLSRVENKLSNQEFVVLTLNPTLVPGSPTAHSANDMLFASTELPNAVIAGRGALIKSVTVIDKDAQGIVASLFFSTTFSASLRDKSLLYSIRRSTSSSM